MTAAYTLPLHLDIERHRSDPEYVPKWAKITRSVPESTISSSKCCYDAYTTNKTIPPASKLLMKEMLHIPLEHTEMIILTCTLSPNLLASCSSCGACPKQGNPFFLHSPDPSTVSHYLSDTNLGKRNKNTNTKTVFCDVFEIQIQILFMYFKYINKYFCPLNISKFQIIFQKSQLLITFDKNKCLKHFVS